MIAKTGALIGLFFNLCVCLFIYTSANQDLLSQKHEEHLELELKIMYSGPQSLKAVKKDKVIFDANIDVV